MGKKNNSSIGIERETIWDKAAIYILALVVFIVPLYLKLTKVKLTDNQAQFWTGDDTVYDIFSYVKAQLLIFALIVLVLYWIIRIALKQSLPTDKIFIPLGCYSLLVIASSLLSDYLDISFMGFVDRYEGLLVTLAYILIMLTSYKVVKSEKGAVVILFSLFISANIISIIGITQFFGVDILQTDFGRRLLVPDEYKALRDTLQFNFADQKMMYSTLYNPNYTGSYTVLILPLVIALFYYYLEKSKTKAFFLFISSLLAFVLWLGGMSRTGLVGGVILFIFFIFFMRKQIIAHWKYSIVLILSCIVLFVGMDIYSGGLVSKEFIDTIPSAIAEDELSAGEGTQGGKSYVKSAILKDNVFSFITETETFIMKLEDEALAFYDDQESPIGIELVNGVITFNDERYRLYSVEMDKNVAYLSYDQAVMPFVFAESKMWYAPTGKLFYDEVGPVESFGFENRLGFGSGRGYLWSRSIPLLKDTLILGHGPDTYPAYFPQQDIAGKINGLGYTTLIADKPHSWYLQIGINTGVLSLIALMVFFCWYIIKALMKWKRTENTFSYFLGTASLCAVIGYCVTAIANDSTVAVAPVFWAVLGIGLATLNNKKLDGLPVKR